MIIPAMAATTLASERERGTLPLLLVMALSPSRIAFGKIFGVFLATLPFVLLTLPIFFSFYAFSMVPFLYSILGFSGALVFAFSLTSCGVWASAVNARSRSASLVALLVSALPGLTGAACVFFGLFEHIDEDTNVRVGLALFGIGFMALVAVAACAGTWAALTPRSANRGRVTRLGPILLAALGPMGLLAWWIDGRRDAASIAAFVSVVASVAALCVWIPGGSVDRSAPSPRTIAFRTIASLFLGTAPLLFVAEGRVADELIVGSAGIFALAGVLAALSSLGRGRLFPVAVTFVMLMVAVLAPAIEDIFTAGTVFLGPISIVYALDEIGLYGGVAVALHVAVGVVGLALGKKRAVTTAL